ncbi:MAG TPA: VOC family protein [Candidatus Limnocylindria bacterium]|jgi:predicted enzyme related to lactoylglutathione lyase|nr:VOC family protein [Candidatus Limnocylindria bacterium]
MPNPVIRWQIVSPEPDKAAQFYHHLFGWELSKANAMGYRELKSGTASTVDGGVWPAPPGQGGFVQLFFEVPDVDACLAKASTLGATVIVPKSVLPDGDTMAVLLDPTGISLGICALAKRG